MLQLCKKINNSVILFFQSSDALIFLSKKFKFVLNN